MKILKLCHKLSITVYLSYIFKRIIGVYINTRAVFDRMVVSPLE